MPSDIKEVTTGRDLDLPGLYPMDIKFNLKMLCFT